MKFVAEAADSVCALYVDMGTTNTRVWLMDGDRVLACANRAVGIRDSAQDGAATIRTALRELIAIVLAETSEPCTPKYLAAAGMITSSLGLTDVPHLSPPAGLHKLASAAQWHRFPDVTKLPVLLVPGVRTGPPNAAIGEIDHCDVMRGEETLCAGLIALNLVSPPAVVLNLGSHWKAVEVDGEGKIRSSVTSLSGELIHAAQQSTILASSVSKERPAHLSAEWVEAGMAEQRSSGLARALFCIRLLDLGNQGTSEDRFAFLIGAFIAADLDALRSRGFIQRETRMALVGNAAIAETWRGALARESISATVIDGKDVEKALLTALREILLQALASRGGEPILQRAQAE